MLDVLGSSNRTAAMSVQFSASHQLVKQIMFAGDGAGEEEVQRLVVLEEMLHPTNTYKKLK